MDFQSMFEAVTEQDRRTRGKYQLTLGKLIERLNSLPADMPLMFAEGTTPTNPRSYRGYYSDLAFGECNEPATVIDLWALCEHCVGQTYGGYKGGDFTMEADTPLWRAEYGCLGTAIMEVRVTDGVAYLICKEIE